MQKEKKVRAYTRKVNGKTVSVRAHTAKYDAAEEARKAFAKKAGAGDELAKTKEVVKEKVEDNGLGFTADEYKAWYHWDMVDDPKNAKALKVRKALIERMGRSAYKKYEDEMSDSYSARGHLKGFKGLGDLKSKEQVAKEKSQAKHIKEKRAREAQEDREKYGKLVAHVNGDASRKYGVTQVSPMVKDEKFTKKVEGDAYSDFFPKGGSYEFFYGKTKDGRVGLYAKNGKSIIELEETEPSAALAKRLGPKPTKPTVGTLQHAISGDTAAQDALLEQHFTKNVSRLTGEVTYSGKGKNDRWMTREEALKKLVPNMATAKVKKLSPQEGKDSTDEGTEGKYSIKKLRDSGRFKYAVVDSKGKSVALARSAAEAKRRADYRTRADKSEFTEAEIEFGKAIYAMEGKKADIHPNLLKAVMAGDKKKSALHRNNGEPSPKSGSGMVTADGVKLRKTKAGKGVFLVGTDGRAYREVTKKDGTTSYKYSAEDTRYVQTDGGRKKLPPKKASTEESSTKHKAGVAGSKIPVNYKITAKSLPKRNPKGTTVKMSATKRNGLFKYLPMQGWALTDTVKSGSTTYGLFRKGDRSIAINTGKDKLYDDVVIQ